MFDSRQQLRNLLLGLARTHPAAPLSEIQRILRGVLGVEDVRFTGRQGQVLPDGLALQNALPELESLQFRISSLDLMSTSPTLAAPAVAAQPSRFREGAPSVDEHNLDEDERYERFLQEFVRLEQSHDFMWAGYIVREMLPRLGFAPEEAKLVLDKLRAEKLVTITKVPNPKNPEFPATGVRLNHEHARVKAMLGERVTSEPE